jgi:hypothetical protein
MALSVEAGRQFGTKSAGARGALGGVASSRRASGVPLFIGLANHRSPATSERRNRRIASRTSSSTAHLAVWRRRR